LCERLSKLKEGQALKPKCPHCRKKFSSPKTFNTHIRKARHDLGNLARSLVVNPGVHPFQVAQDHLQRTVKRGVYVWPLSAAEQVCVDAVAAIWEKAKSSPHKNHIDKKQCVDPDDSSKIIGQYLQDGSVMCIQCDGCYALFDFNDLKRHAQKIHNAFAKTILRPGRRSKPQEGKAKNPRADRVIKPKVGGRLSRKMATLSHTTEVDAEAVDDVEEMVEHAEEGTEEIVEDADDPDAITEDAEETDEITDDAAEITADRNTTDNNLETQEFTCPTCTTNFRNKRMFSVHMKIRHKKRTDNFECNGCHKAFSSWVLLKSHKKKACKTPDLTTHWNQIAHLETVIQHNLATIATNSTETSVDFPVPSVANDADIQSSSETTTDAPKTPAPLVMEEPIVQKQVFVEGLSLNPVPKQTRAAGGLGRRNSLRTTLQPLIGTPEGNAQHAELMRKERRNLLQRHRRQQKQKQVALTREG
jgi:uncharacterized C2H2 Zn-finger protein